MSFARVRRLALPLTALLAAPLACSRPAPPPAEEAGVRPSAASGASPASASAGPSAPSGVQAPGAALADSPLALANLAASLAASGDLDGAEAALLRALEQTPDAPPLLAELGRVRLAAGRAAEAVGPAVRAADRGRGSDGRYYLLATSARLRAGQPAEARQDLERWSREFGEAPLLRVSRGLLHERAGRPGEAEGEYRAALEADPGCEEAVSGLVKLRFESGDPAGALAAVRGSRAAGAARRIWEAQALRRLGRVEEAEAPLRAALASEPDHPAALAELGALLAVRGRYEEARGFLARALALQPGLEQARANLAEVERHLGGGPGGPSTRP